MKFQLTALLLANLAAPVMPCAAQSTLPSVVVLVRHADRAAEPGKDPPISEQGRKRAKDLAAALRDISFAGILTTQFIRTQETAEPTATSQKITVEVVPFVQDLDKHLSDLRVAMQRYAGKPVLVVEHSNTLASVVTSLGGPKLPNVCENVYDHLLTLVPGQTTQLLMLRYGDRSPEAGPNCM